MAKQSVPCMFCNELPCRCDGVKKPRAKKSRTPAELPVAPDSSVNDDLSEFAPEPIKRTFKVKDRDLSLESALRNLREIVCERDRIAIDHELQHPDPPDIKKRESEWRAKHGSQDPSS